MGANSLDWPGPHGTLTILTDHKIGRRPRDSCWMPTPMLCRLMTTDNTALPRGPALGKALRGMRTRCHWPSNFSSIQRQKEDQRGNRVVLDIFYHTKSRLVWSSELKIFLARDFLRHSHLPVHRRRLWLGNYVTCWLIIFHWLDVRLHMAGRSTYGRSLLDFRPAAGRTRSACSIQALSPLLSAPTARGHGRPPNRHQTGANRGSEEHKRRASLSTLKASTLTRRPTIKAKAAMKVRVRSICLHHLSNKLPVHRRLCHPCNLCYVYLCSRSCRR